MRKCVKVDKTLAVLQVPLHMMYSFCILDIRVHTKTASKQVCSCHASDTNRNPFSVENRLIKESA